MTPQAKSAEELLKERAQLESELERYQRLVTVMFTDIAGSTRYFDMHGDLAGMAMLTEVHDTLSPLVRDFRGVVVKTIGDAIMAYYENPVDAVRSAMQMQRAMVELNKRRSEQVQIRVALNLGVGLLKDKDVFGDVVNVCSRIEHETEASRIGVSPSVVEATRQEKDIVCRKIGEVALRGKRQKMELYEVLWREGEVVKEVQPAKVSGEQLALATGTRIGLEEDVRAAIAEALKTKGKVTKLYTAPKKFTLVQVLPDRTLGKRFPLKGNTAVVGREKGDIVFADDPLMSREHAVFTALGGALYVEDLGSANGTFVGIRKPPVLEDSDIILLGRQMFRFTLKTGDAALDAGKKDGGKKEGDKKATEKKAAEKPPAPPATKPTEKPPEGQSPTMFEEPVKAELIRLIRGGQEEKHFSLQRGENTFGRTQGTYTFPDDPYLSRVHARLILHGRRCVLEDLKSTNGTFIRIRERHLLDEEDTVLIGSQFLRVQAEAGE